MGNKDVLQYATGSKVLHWLIAVLVIGMLAGGFFMDDLPATIKPVVYMIHKSIGLTILGLMLIRLVWIIQNGKPRLPESVTRLERVASRAIQHTFYLLLILMPLSVWVLSNAANRPPVYFGLVLMPFPGISPNESLANFMGLCHEIMAYTLIVLIFLHVAGALKHHFIDKDVVLRRMLW